MSNPLSDLDHELTRARQTIDYLLSDVSRLRGELVERDMVIEGLRKELDGLDKPNHTN